MNFSIFADGSSLGNPGSAGAGVVVYNGNVVKKEIAAPLGVTTNNVAEYTAMVIALSEALRLKGEFPNTKEKIPIYTDSALVANQITGKFKVKNQNLKPFYLLARHILSLTENCEIVYIQREKNKKADSLARKASGQSRAFSL